MGTFDGKVAVVTGGTSGIGLATARRLADDGARVYVMGRREAELKQAVDEIGHGAVGVRGDVADLADLDRLFAAVEEHGVDVLFANAGGGEFTRLEDVTEKHFDQTFDANVKGTLFTVQKALPHLNEGASVILTGSTAAGSGAEAFGVYAASKAAIRSFARTWANELKGRGVRVNAIVPGPIATPGIDGLAADEAGAAQLKGYLTESVPIGRMGRPEEVAGAVAFLASDQSSFITGSELYVDGGLNQI
ncbi:SDR family NAD(P)-dependent oxidoreductase [Herbidospora cretacea]|uniref:SDR family NAD(P)-dependent oxidoreductase n=1 Tax=Herbidospora cretacea TaxID=28444 RepID=UPI0007734DDC|nr:SDR family oxidoreductase [Herbidospora cretacea]